MRATIVGVLSGESRCRLERRGRFVLRAVSCWRSAMLSTMSFARGRHTTTRVATKTASSTTEK